MATLKDIAQQVGVSVSAVSLALRDHPSIETGNKKADLGCQDLDQCARQGLRVPQDISLISLGAVMYETRPTLATVEANPVDLGRGIFEKLQRMMARPDYLITREHFPMRLIPGDSLGPIA